MIQLSSFIDNKHSLTINYNFASPAVSSLQRMRWASPLIESVLEIPSQVDTPGNGCLQKFSNNIQPKVIYVRHTIPQGGIQQHLHRWVESSKPSSGAKRKTNRGEVKMLHWHKTNKSVLYW